MNFSQYKRLFEDAPVFSIPDYESLYDKHVEQAIKDDIQKLKAKYNNFASYNDIKSYDIGIAPNEYKKLNNDLRVSKYSSNLNAIYDVLEYQNFKELIYCYVWCEKNWPDAVDNVSRQIWHDIEHYYNAVDTKFADNVKYNVKKLKYSDPDFLNSNIFTDAVKQFCPSNRDWEKMIIYYSHNSNTKQLVSSCKDLKKIMARFVISAKIGWEDAYNAFESKLNDYGYSSYFLYTIAKYYIDNFDIPEIYQEMLDDIKNDSDIITPDSKYANIDKRILKLLSSYGSYRILDNLELSTTIAGVQHYCVFELRMNKNNKKCYIFLFYGNVYLFHIVNDITDIIQNGVIDYDKLCAKSKPIMYGVKFKRGYYTSGSSVAHSFDEILPKLKEELNYYNYNL